MALTPPPAAAAAAGLLALVLAPADRPTPATIAALPPAATAGRGAALPFVEYEAENAITDGRMVGPSRAFGDIAAEASSRRAIRLDRRGQFVEFVLARAADAMTLRAALPDSADGRGRDATLTVRVDGRPAGRIALTSRYGWFYGAYPFTNRPSDGGAHHMFDESRLMFGRSLPPGTRVRLTISAGDDAPWYVLDLADFEAVPPPRTRPPGALSVLAFGADPTGTRSSADALQRGIDAAQRARVPLWLPPGTYRADRHLLVDRVRILGAGPWYTTVRGDGVGFYGKPAPGGSRGVELGDFAIVGEVVDRVDQAARNGIGGAMGGGTVLHDLYLQHHKVGAWFDGPMQGIRLRRLRIVDCTADGLNFHRGVSDAVVEDSLVRNTGDDGLAAWSHGMADHDVAFRRNTIVAPILANGIAVYGGHDIAVVDNVVSDTLREGGGLHVGNRFDAVPVGGTIRLAGNVVVRGGSVDPRWHSGIGALWFYALDAPMTAAVRVERATLLDSTAAAVQFRGKPIRGVTLDRLRVRRAGGPAFLLQAEGTARVRDGAISDVMPQPPSSGGFRLAVSRTAGLARTR
jgi:hypothetical protein